MHDAAKASADGYRDEGPLRIVVPTSSLCTILPDDANASTSLEETAYEFLLGRSLGDHWRRVSKPLCHFYAPRCPINWPHDSK